MFNGKLNQFCKDVNEIVRSKGFWASMHDALDQLGFSRDYQLLGEDFKDADFLESHEKDIMKATKDAFISQKIALIMSECGEALEAMRKDNYGLEKKDSFEDEIADVFIRLSDLCGELDIDIEKQIEWKLNYNKNRDNKHGKNF